MYGPTETTIWSLVGRVESGAGQVPIGSPIANTQIYLLDKHRHQPVPIRRGTVSSTLAAMAWRAATGTGPS